MWGEMKDIKEKWPQYFATRAEGGIGFECGPGWHQTIRELLAFIEVHLPEADFKIVQIKEKFGYLTIYTQYYDEQIDKLVRRACHNASEICEFCGATEGVERKSWANWVKTLCQECGPKYRDGWRPWVEEYNG